MSESLKILVVGKGGREHALIKALRDSESRPELYAYPGSDAIAELAQIVKNGSGVAALVTWMQNEEIDLCVVGEESYLMQGLADYCEAAGISCWGPLQESAQLEGSKAFAKAFMERHNIPTAKAEVCHDRESTEAAIKTLPVVLKFDGLAGGKGVAVCSQIEGRHGTSGFADQIFEEKRFGEGSLLVEEYLEGPEVSIIAAVVDSHYQIFTPARDYKRLGDGDSGPNTGGMGVVASRELIDKETLDRIEREIIKPTVAGLSSEGHSYRGFLYFGIMLTADGPKLLEYNCRFGDPECQAIMPLMKGNFAHYLLAASQGELREDLLTFDNDWSVCLVMASAGYPENARSGDTIEGLGLQREGLIYHAGTRRMEDGTYATHGGRVLAVVARASNRPSAVDKVYEEATSIRFDGVQMRSDIGRLHF